MRKQHEAVLTGNLTAMIDVVFQLIIFFVCTANLQDSAMNQEIQLPLAPNGVVDSRKDPREININVTMKGEISIGRVPMSQSLLFSIINKAVKEQGNDIPVVIRADGDAKHEAVKKVMDACSQAGVYAIQIAALRERGK